VPALARQQALNVAKIIFTIEDTDTGLVSVVSEVSGATVESNALKLAVDVGYYIDARAEKIAGDTLAPNEPKTAKILLPGTMRH
jgi:hypothetical protein